MKSTIDIATVYLDENDFCRIDLDTNKKDFLDEQNATELCETIGKVCNHQPKKLLTDATQAYGFVSAEARSIIRNHPAMLKVRKAEAFLITPLANRLVVRVYLKFDKPPNPVKIFNNKEDAINWLKKIKIDN